MKVFKKIILPFTLTVGLAGFTPALVGNLLTTLQEAMQMPEYKEAIQMVNDFNSENEQVNELAEPLKDVVNNYQDLLNEVVQIGNQLQGDE